tara:strand:- start:2175 stop:2777 length:603 start_codon:yes stop_codon:yes gene_type:complete
MNKRLEEKLKKLDKKCYKELEEKEMMLEFKTYNKEFKMIKEKINKQIEKTLEHLISLKRNKVVILSGYPGSGKSTITNVLKENNYKVLSMDDNIKNYKELLDKTIKMIEYNNDQNIVLDGTFLKQEQIDIFSFINDIQGYDLITIYIDIPIKFAYFNNIKRCLDRRNNRTVIPIRVYQAMEKSKNIKVPNNNYYVIRYKD